MLFNGSLFSEYEKDGCRVWEINTYCNIPKSDTLLNRFEGGTMEVDMSVVGLDNLALGGRPVSCICSCINDAFMVVIRWMALEVGTLDVGDWGFCG